MKISENAVNIVALRKIKGIGPAWIAQKITADLNDEEIIKLAREKFPSLNKLDFCKYKEEAREELEALENTDGVIAFCDEEFPQYKSKIKDGDKPVLLTYKGDLKLLDQNLLKIAVIGFLNPDEKIKRLEEKILDKILEKDAVIVSGLANGCDQKAHEYTLQNNGATIAILPSTLKNILPSSNAELAQEIVRNGGLLISEYFAECKSPKYEQSQRYIERDRLQALFSDAVCLVASYSEEDKRKDKSKDIGSRHALNKAKEWGIVRLTPKIYEGNPIFNERFNLNREILNDTNEPAIEISGENTESVLNKIIQLKFGKNEYALF